MNSFGSFPSQNYNQNREQNSSQSQYSSNNQLGDRMRLPPKANEIKQVHQKNIVPDIENTEFQPNIGMRNNYNYSNNYDNSGMNYNNVNQPNQMAGYNESYNKNMSPNMPKFTNNNLSNSEYELIKNEFENNIQPFNCSKEYLSSTVGVFPGNNNMITKNNIPVGLTISPMSNKSGNVIPIVDYNPNKIPRCPNSECRAYLNPFVKFIDGGEKWICNFCGMINNTEDYYYCDVDKNGVRLDQYTKTELCCGSYEFVTDKSYWKKNKTPTEALFIFMLETSISSINSGFLSACLESIKEVVNNDGFYNGVTTKVCFITYDSGVQFYCFNKRQTQPKVLTVLDEPVFVPTIKDNLIFKVGEDKDKILQIIELIQNNMTNNNYINNQPKIKDSEKIFSALNGAYLIGRNAGGKILIFSSSNSLCNINKMNGTDLKNLSKEEIAYTCTDKKQLGNMGINLTNENLSVDIIASAESQIKLLTLNQLCEHSNGNLYFYKNFNLDLHYKNLFNQINRILTRPICWEGVCRTRFSNKFKISSYLTPVLLTNEDLFVFPTGDSDQCYTIGLSIKSSQKPEEDQDKKEMKSNLMDNNLYDKSDENSNKYVYIQTALLYSYGDGTRRVRVHNLCLPISNSLKDILDSVNQEVIAEYYLKSTIDKIYKTKNIINSISATDISYKHFIQSIFSLQQSMKKELPKNLGLLPLYMLGIFKHRIFCKDEVEKKYDLDLSNYLRIKLLKMSIQEILCFICPFIYCMHELESNKELGKLNEETQSINFPNIIEPTEMNMTDDGLYLIDNGYLLIIYIRKNVSKNILKSLFGVEDLRVMTLIVNEENVFKDLDDFKERFANILDAIREGKSLYQNLIFVFEGTNSDRIIKDSMIEDNYCNWFKINYEGYYNKCLQESSIGRF